MQYIFVATQRICVKRDSGKLTGKSRFGTSIGNNVVKIVTLGNWILDQRERIYIAI